MRLFSGSPAFDRLLLAAACFWLTFPYFILGKYSFIVTGSAWMGPVDANMAMRYVDPARPYWYPFGASGTDLLSMGFVYDTPRWLFQHLPGWLAYQIWQVGPMLAAAAAMYALARRRLGLGGTAAVFAAFLAVQPFENHQPYHTAVLLAPAVLWGLFRLFDDLKSWRRWLIVAALCVLYATSGILPMLLIFPVIFVVVGTLFLYRPLRLNHFVVVAGFFIVVYALRIESILASLHNAPFSHRQFWTHPSLTGQYFSSGLDAVIHGLGDGIGSLSGGITATNFGLLLTALAWVLVRGRDRPLALATGAIAASLMLTVLLPPAKAVVSTFIPAGRSFGADRLWWYGALFVPFGAAFLVEALPGFLSRRGFSPRWIILPFIVVLGFSLGDKIRVQPYDWIAVGNYVRNIESPPLRVLAERIRESGVPERVLSHQLYDNNFHGYGLETIGGQFNLYPERYRRFWSKLIQPSFGFDPLCDFQTRDYGSYMTLGMTCDVKDTSPEVRLSTKANLNLVSLANGRYVVSRKKLTDPELIDLRLGRPEKPWDDLSSLEKVKVNFRENFTGRTNLHVYENPAALPRYRLVERIEVLPDESQVLDRIVKMPAEALRQTVVLDAAAARIVGPSSTHLAVGKIRIVEHRTDLIAIDVEAEGEAFLVAANSYSPFWKCRIDGVEAPIVPAYSAFWGVKVPPGAKRIEFSFEPPYALFRSN